MRRNTEAWKTLYDKNCVGKMTKAGLFTLIFK